MDGGWCLGFFWEAVAAGWLLVAAGCVVVPRWEDPIGSVVFRGGLLGSLAVVSTVVVGFVW